MNILLALIAMVLLFSVLQASSVAAADYLHMQTKEDAKLWRMN